MYIHLQVIHTTVISGEGCSPMHIQETKTAWNAGKKQIGRLTSSIHVKFKIACIRTMHAIDAHYKLPWLRACIRTYQDQYLQYK